MQLQYIQIKLETKKRFTELQKELQTKSDFKLNQDYILKKLMDKYEGDLQ